MANLSSSKKMVRKIATRTARNKSHVTNMRTLIKKVEELKDKPVKAPIKTWSRKSTIIPEFIGTSFLIHNGKKFIPIKISEEMVGHKLGEFSPTRTYRGHGGNKKK